MYRQHADIRKGVIPFLAFERSRRILIKQHEVKKPNTSVVREDVRVSNTYNHLIY